jgi:hypothetical protein
MIAFSFVSPAMMRGMRVAVVATVAAVGSAGVARAQTSSAPALDSLQTNTMPAVPLDQRQPRRVHLPSNVHQQEDSELSSERTFDQQLRICRGC